MKITITHPDVKVEYSDDKPTPNSYELMDILRTLGDVVKMLKNEKENRGTTTVPRDMGGTPS